MAEVTRSVTRIYDRKLIDMCVKEERKKRLELCFQEFMEKFNELVGNNQWVRIENRALYYLPEDDLLIADAARWELYDTSYRYDMDGIGNGRALTYEEAAKYFYTYKNRNPMVGDNWIFYILNHETIFKQCVSFYQNGEKSIHINDCSGRTWGYSSKNNVKIPIFNNSEPSSLELFFKYNLTPFGGKTEENAFLNIIKHLYENNIIMIEKISSTAKCSLKFSDEYIKKVLSGEIDSLNKVSFKKTDIIQQSWKQPVSLTQEIKELLYQPLLESDTRRIDLEHYDEKILEDPNRGHWELWNTDEDSKDYIEIDTKLVARNPLADINKNGVIGIDFGTKSTIVTYKNGVADVSPMRVGSGKFKRELKKENYENPTVMEFIDIENFMRCYRENEGRPHTLWADVLVSHAAAEQLKDGNDETGSAYSAFFSDLKQWTGDKDRRIRIRDRKGHEEVLPPFLEVTDEFNPIELYAYYLGLFINNMYQKIYLRYKLSFPVTYEVKVREKILNSFEAGLKKSLPQPVLDNKEAMDKFKVEQGISEPAAYAVCGLQEYGFDPEGEEQIFYGIFDFGGGTTDFDFGVWQSEEENTKRYDYVITHFGAGGDSYLGGENLLEYMAYEIFKDNKKELLEKDITFSKPHGCKEFAGSELLLSTSQQARLNMKKLAEALRGYWEMDMDMRGKLKEEESIKIGLLTKQGKLLSNLSLEINTEKLDEVLYGHIEKGVRQFFNALKATFIEKNAAYTGKVGEIHIFLAGNSSKSPIVMELFEKYINEYSAEIVKHAEDMDKEKNIFKIYPPLGTKQAKMIQRGELQPLIGEIITSLRDELGFNSDEYNEAEALLTKEEMAALKEDDDSEDEEFDNDKFEDQIIRPTGKTGVAFGLLETRVRVVNEMDGEVKFRYYLGENRKKHFHCIVNREMPYGEWIEFIDASEEEFEIYYTSLPEATTNKLLINEMGIHYVICDLAQTDEEANVYIRLVKPTVIEYIVATDEEIKSGQVEESKIQQIELG